MSITIIPAFFTLSAVMMFVTACLMAESDDDD